MTTPLGVALAAVVIAILWHWPPPGADAVDPLEANHRRLISLVQQSNDAIAAFDAAHPEATP